MIAIYKLLQRLGVTPKYKGFRKTAIAMSLIAANPRRLEAVTKEVYMVVGDETGTHWKTVERSIRTVVQRVWDVNPQLLQEMAGYPLQGPPTASEFLAILAGQL